MTREPTTAHPAASPLLHLPTVLLMLVALAMPLAAGCEIVAPPESTPEAPDSDGQGGDGGGDDPIDRTQGPVVVQGSDYTLPDWAQPEPSAGYVDHPDAGAAHLGTSLRNRWVNWADLEPAHGVYDWSIVDRMLEEAEAGGYEVYLQIRSVTCGGGDPDRGVVIPNAIPGWVFDEFDLDDGDCINLGGEWQIEVIPAWREDVRTAFNDMIRAFGEAGYPQRSALGGAYIHGISASRGEEFWLEPWQVATLESRAGFSATVLEEWIESRMDAYADGFGSRIDRVAWVGKVDIWHYCGQDYADAAWSLVQYAWDIGAGNRSSTVEAFHLSLEEPALGQWVDDQGYLHTDESIPPLADGRYFGDENEEYGDGWIWRFGDVQGDWQRYRFAVLRALQMQMRFLWTSASAELLDPALSRYAGRSFGKTVTSSPDAWCYLKESAVGGWVTPVSAVKNFERWLVQRDVPGGMTVATDRVDRAFNAGNIGDGHEGAFFDYTARRTDLAEGQPCIYFDLDDRFVTDGPLQIKVEIRDDTTASWRIEHAGPGGALTSTETFTGMGDGEVKTVTFPIPDARFAGDLDHGMDFRIICDGPGDVTVRWVRLVRLEQP